jgi:hypothetical protein
MKWKMLDGVTAASSEIRKHACRNSVLSVTRPSGSYAKREATAETGSPVVPM